MLAHWYVPGLWGEPTSQTAQCPVWEHGLSLLLTEFGVEGGETGRSRFPPTGPTHGVAGSWSLFVGL